MTKAKFDIKQHVTDAIIAQLEAGIPPWRKPWSGGAGGGGTPLRHIGEAYRGINILMLWASAHVGRYTSNRWLTFKQAKDLGGMVKKGSVCTKSVYYGSFDAEQERGCGESESSVAHIRYAKFFNVFNANQIDGLPEAYYVWSDPPKDLGAKADPELKAFFAATEAKIVTTEEPSAYYSPSKDHIHMPPIQTFFSAAEYYSTLAHESCHWICGEPRLATQKANANRQEYAFDELVAELGASFLAVQLGFEPAFDQRAAYLKSWLEALKADKGLVFKAAAEAQRAVDELNARVNVATVKEVAA